jgi:hypothetical protein
MVTKLQAVNASLLAIGQQLVATLEDALDIDATQALILLDEINEEIQSEGWAFNTDDNLTLTPNSLTGYITIPSNYINVRSVGTPTVQVRNGKLYNQSTQTDVFTSDVTAEVIRLVPFEETPAPFALYIKSLLVRRFQERFLGDSTMTQTLALEEQQALLRLRNWDNSVGQYNLLEGL